MLAVGTFVLLGESARDPSVPSPWAARRRHRRTDAGACRRLRRSPARRRPDRPLHRCRHASARRRRDRPRDRPAGRRGIGEFDATTGADGAVVLSGVPVETGEGPAVVLDVAADKETTFTDDESGCTFIDTWHAERLAVAVDGRRSRSRSPPRSSSPTARSTARPRSRSPRARSAGSSGRRRPARCPRPTRSAGAAPAARSRSSSAGAARPSAARLMLVIRAAPRAVDVRATRR